MHSYHCGKNLDLDVTVVNRFSNLSWMISQWFCWSWDLHRLMPIYLPSFFFFLKELNQCKSKNEKRYWAVKVIAHTNIQLEKRESDIYENVWCPKAKGLPIKLKYQKFQASILKWDVLFQNDQILWNVWNQMKSFKIM